MPDGFFVDERAGTAQSYTVHHGLDDSGSYELCADDFEAALSIWFAPSLMIRERAFRPAAQKEKEDDLRGCGVIIMLDPRRP